MNRQEAANFLKVSERTISNYQKQGLLTTIKKGRTLLFNITELETLRDLKIKVGAGQLIPKKEILQLQARVSRLESQMRVINMMLDSKSGNLNLSHKDAQELYAQLVHSISSYKDLAQTSIESWIEIFYQVDENTISTLSISNSDPDCWKKLLDLCNLFIDKTVSDNNYESSINLQSRHKGLCEARRRLRVSSVIYLEMEGRVASAVAQVAPKFSPNSLLEELRKAVKK